MIEGSIISGLVSALVERKILDCCRISTFIKKNVLSDKRRTKAIKRIAIGLGLGIDIFTLQHVIHDIISDKELGNAGH